MGFKMKTCILSRLFVDQIVEKIIDPAPCLVYVIVWRGDAPSPVRRANKTGY